MVDPQEGPEGAAPQGVDAGAASGTALGAGRGLQVGFRQLSAGTIRLWGGHSAS